MTQNKFISSDSEPKSGLSAEETRNLENKIDAVWKRIDELNGESLEIKAEMALKNKFISPQQEKELFELVNDSSALYDRYNQGERTEDLLAGLESHYQVLEQKRNEIFLDAPKDPRLELAEKEEIEDSGKNKDALGEGQPMKDGKEVFAERQKQKEELIGKLDTAYKELYGFLSDKKEAPKEIYDLIRQTENELRGAVKFRGEVADIVETIKEKYKKDERSEEEKVKKGKKISQKSEDAIEKGPVKKTGFTKQMVETRAMEIKQRRIAGESGFEWEKIDALLRENNLEPGTPEADKFMAEWDEKMARQELIKEEKQKKAAEIIDKPALEAEEKEEEKKREFLKITSRKEEQERKAELPPEIREILVSAVEDFRQRLQAEAAAMEGWEKYKPEQQATLLGIEAESFLRNLINERLVPKGVISAENVDALVADLLNEKPEASAASVALAEKVKAPETVVEKKDISVDFSAMTDLYNQEGDEFQKKYADAIKGFGAANSAARRENPAVEPEFVVDSNPGLWGVLEGGQMLVFPKKGQDFNNALIVRIFAMNKVFDWSGTIDSIAKGIYKVIRPAIFASDGNKWKIAKKGKLEF